MLQRPERAIHSAVRASSPSGTPEIAAAGAAISRPTVITDATSDRGSTRRPAREATRVVVAQQHAAPNPPAIASTKMQARAPAMSSPCAPRLVQDSNAPRPEEIEDARADR